MDTNTMYRPLADDEIRNSLTPSPVDAWTPIVPVPPDAPSPTTGMISRFAKPGFSFTNVWRYNDASGTLLGCVVRFDKPANGAPAEKDIAPSVRGRMVPASGARKAGSARALSTG